MSSQPSRSLLTFAAALALALVGDACPSPALRSPYDGSQQRWIWPTSGKVTQPFGCTGFWAEPRRGSCAHFHGGIDIANDRGTPVRAVADGVVELVGWDPWIRPDPDWMVIINHGNGLRTMYAHLRAKPVDGIERGDARLPGPAHRPDGHDRPRDRVRISTLRCISTASRSTRATISTDPCPALSGTAGPPGCFPVQSRQMASGPDSRAGRRMVPVGDTAQPPAPPDATTDTTSGYGIAALTTRCSIAP